MFKKLLEYNWKVFYRSLSGAKIFVLLTYGLLLGFVFSQIIGSGWVIITMRDTELSNIFAWYTPERGEFILQAFANMLWLAQFFFTNIRVVNLEENRKLLTVGFPVTTLSRYLTILAVFHPLNLLFCISWFVLLMLQFGNWLYLPLVFAIVLTNLLVIFSLKFRFLSIVKNYQKWLLVLALSGLFLAGGYIDQFFTSTFFYSFENHLPIINKYIGLLPGSLMAVLPSLGINPINYLVVIVLSGGACYFLHRDHVINTRKGLQAHNTRPKQSQKSGFFCKWLCSRFGNHAGKYLYYVLTHPYNKIQGFFFLAFPLLYIPFMISNMKNMGQMQFIVLFIFMYAPMGFELIFLGNMFGYEHRELLKEMQFPINVDHQLKERLTGAIIIPLTLLLLVSGAEFIILMESPKLLSILLGNALIFELFLGLFLWSTFHQFKKVQWVSFSFTQPVISQSVAIVVSLLMVLLSALFYISYGSYEIYKQAAMVVLILASGFWISRFINTIQQRFTEHITPHLWNEL